MKHITVIGPGRWGSFIAYYLQTIGHNVTLYGRQDSPQMKQLLDHRQNDYLHLPKDLKLEIDLDKALEAPIIVISINSQNLRDLLKEINAKNIHDKTFVLCMKGIEISSQKRLSEIVDEEISFDHKVACWIGPGHPQEFVKGNPNAMVIDSNDRQLVLDLIDEFSSPLIRFYVGEDLIGNEIGAAAKNVMGIAAGLLDGIHLSSLKGALMSRGCAEVSRLIRAMGGNPLSAYGLCHLGDYEATVFSKYSNNRAFGEAFIRQEPFEKLAEGYYTTQAMVKLGETYEVDLPITKAVYEITIEKKDPQEVLRRLFLRSTKAEFYT